MGKKYIIELEETPFVQHFKNGAWETIYRVKGFNSLVFDWNGLQMLTPYTEDSAYAHGYTEAESKYREIRDELEKQAYQRGYETAERECEDCQKNRADAEQELVKKAYDTAYADAEGIYESGKRAMYQKGLKDAWEAARTLWNTPNRKEIFGHTTFNTVLTTLTAQETIEKIRQYEQEKEAFHVGDEFENESGKRFVILKMDCDEIDRYIDEEGKTYCMTIKYRVMRKTGRHFPEIAEVLAKMKETDNG